MTASPRSGRSALPARPRSGAAPGASCVPERVRGQLVASRARRRGAAESSPDARGLIGHPAQRSAVQVVDLEVERQRARRRLGQRLTSDLERDGAVAVSRSSLPAARSRTTPGWVLLGVERARGRQAAATSYGHSTLMSASGHARLISASWRVASRISSGERPGPDRLADVAEQLARVPLDHPRHSRDDPARVAPELRSCRAAGSTRRGRRAGRARRPHASARARRSPPARPRSSAGVDEGRRSRRGTRRSPGRTALDAPRSDCDMCSQAVTLTGLPTPCRRSGLSLAPG